jgi:hypothetical protein
VEIFIEKHKFEIKREIHAMKRQQCMAFLWKHVSESWCKYSGILLPTRDRRRKRDVTNMITAGIPMCLDITQSHKA